MRRNTQAADPFTAGHRYGFFNWPSGVAVVVVVVVDVVVFVRPCATVLFPLFVRVVVVVLVLPGAVVLLPRVVPGAGVVFVCPGAAVLCPRDLVPAGGLVFPGADALFPGEAPTRRVALGALALKTAAGTAGRRSDRVGWRGSSTFGSTGGP